MILTSGGDKKIQVIKVVRAATGLGLKEAKAVVDDAPQPVKEGIEREEADKLKAEGWDVRKVKIDNGCYEVYGFDGKGQRREAYFNPKTFELVGDVPQK